MLSATLITVIFICGALQTSASGNDTIEATKKTETKERSGRWYGDSDSEVPLGYYASPDTPVFSLDNVDSKRKDTSKSNLPSSFDDFIPEKGSQKVRYSYPKGGVPFPNTDWKGYPIGNPPAPWMFPSDMSDMMNAMKDVTPDEKPMGLFAKLASEPTAIFLATFIPLTLLSMAALPPIIKFFSGAGSSNPIITTTAAEGGRMLRSDEPSFISSILGAIDNFDGKGSDQLSCLQRNICQFTNGINRTEFGSIHREVTKTLNSMDESWLERLGIQKFMQALRDGDCEKIRCPEKPGKYFLFHDIDSLEKKGERDNEK